MFIVYSWVLCLLCCTCWLMCCSDFLCFVCWMSPYCWLFVLLVMRCHLEFFFVDSCSVFWVHCWLLCIVLIVVLDCCLHLVMLFDILVAIVDLLIVVCIMCLHLVFVVCVLLAHHFVVVPLIVWLFSSFYCCCFNPIALWLSLWHWCCSCCDNVQLLLSLWCVVVIVVM